MAQAETLCFHVHYGINHSFFARMLYNGSPSRFSLPTARSGRISMWFVRFSERNSNFNKPAPNGLFGGENQLRNVIYRETFKHVFLVEETPILAQWNPPELNEIRYFPSGGNWFA